MKRSQVVDLIAAWAKPEIFEDNYGGRYLHWADDLLYTLETEFGLGITDDPEPFEPEEGWDEYFAKQDRIEQQRDFEIIDKFTHRMITISKLFLDGESFEEIAKEYKVTRERVRQIINKCRRVYNNEKK